MNAPDLPRRLAAEALGTAFLLMAVVGSGVMAQRLSGGNDALALLGNTLATGAALVVLISIFGPVSGAHFNPVVTLCFALRRETGAGAALLYMAVQLAGALAGVFAAHAMFAMPLLEVSTKLRDGPGQGLAEFIATFGLIVTILGALRHRAEAIPMLVGLYITAAYWFTASTSFANPAVTVARAFTDSFSGIAPSCVPLFVLAQGAGALAALAVSNGLFRLSTPAENKLRPE